MSEVSHEPPPTIRRGVYLTGTGTTLTIVILFVETMVIIRLLPPESYGVAVLLTAVVNFFVMAVDFGCKTTVTKLIAGSDPVRQARIASNAIVFRLASLIVLSALVWLGQDLLVPLDPTRAILSYTGYLPLMLFAGSFDELLSALLQGFQAYRDLTIAQVGRSVLRLVTTVVLLVGFQLGVLALIYSWSLSFVLSAGYQFLTLPTSKRFSCQRSIMGEILYFGVPLQLTRFLWFVFGKVNVLLIGAFAGPASVAYYAVAARIPESLQRFSDSFIAVYFPTMSALFSGGRHSQATKTLNHSLRLISFAVGLIALTAVVFSNDIVTLLFSDQYAASSPVFAMLMIALHMTLMVNVMGYTLTSAGFPGRSLGENVTRTTLNIIGDLLLIPAMGFSGAALATIGATYASNPVAVWLLRRSKIAVVAGPYARQTLLLLLCVGLFVWIHPQTAALKVSVVLLFAAMNLALSTVSPSDIGLILPESLLKRSRLGKSGVVDGN